MAARPEGRRYRAGKFVRRHRVGIAVAVSLLLSLVAGLAATAWQARAKTLEAQKAEAVKAFLISIFQGADPVQAAGRDITLRQVLDEGAERVQRDLAGPPAVQGELLTVLAGIYAELGVTERAHGADRSGARHPPAAVRRRQRAGRHEPAAEGEPGLARGDADTADRFAQEALGEAPARLRQPASGRRRGPRRAADRGAPARPAGRRACRRRGIAAHPESDLRQRASTGGPFAEQPRYPQERSGSLRRIRRPVPARPSTCGGACSATSIPTSRSRSTTCPRSSSFEASSSRPRPRRKRRWSGSAGVWRGPPVDAVGAQQRRQHRSDARSFRRGGSGTAVRPRFVGQNARHGSPERLDHAGQSGARPSRARRSGSSRAYPSRCRRTLAPPDGRGAPDGAPPSAGSSEALSPTADDTTRPAGCFARRSIGCEPRTARRTRRSPRPCTSWDNWRAAAATSPRRNHGSAKRSRCAARSWRAARLTAKTLAALGAARLAGTRPVQRTALLEDAVAILRRTLPASHPFVVAATRDLERARQTSAPAR